MTAPRNRKAFERGQELRSEILSMLEGHSPTAPALTAKHILARLSRQPPPSLRTIQWHLHAIRYPQRHFAHHQDGCLGD
jgi:hypothetical protein